MLLTDIRQGVRAPLQKESEMKEPPTCIPRSSDAFNSRTRLLYKS